MEEEKAAVGVEVGRAFWVAISTIASIDLRSPVHIGRLFASHCGAAHCAQPIHANIHWHLFGCHGLLFVAHHDSQRPLAPAVEAEAAVEGEGEGGAAFAQQVWP